MNVERCSMQRFCEEGGMKCVKWGGGGGGEVVRDRWDLKHNSSYTVEQTGSHINVCIDGKRYGNAGRIPRAKHSLSQMFARKY